MDTKAFVEARERNNKRQRYVVLVLWAAIGFVYFSMAGQWISVNMNDRALADYMNHVVRVAATENRPPKEVRQLMLVKAEQLSLPLTPEGIRVVAEEKRVRAILHYEKEVSIPIIQRPVYRMSFVHDLRHNRLNAY